MVSRSSYRVKMIGQSARLQDKNATNVVGATE